jgi:hypothetical protein
MADFDLDQDSALIQISASDTMTFFTPDCFPFWKCVLVRPAALVSSTCTSAVHAGDWRASPLKFLLCVMVGI